jgi:hypothetical protein
MRLPSHVVKLLVHSHGSPTSAFLTLLCVFERQLPSGWHDSFSLHWHSTHLPATHVWDGCGHGLDLLHVGEGISMQKPFWQTRESLHFRVGVHAFSGMQTVLSQI